MRRLQPRKQSALSALLNPATFALLFATGSQPSLLSQSIHSTHASHHTMQPLGRPQPLSLPRPTPEDVKQWSERKFGMFIHFGLYSTLGGVWQGKQIDNGYSEQIMANAPIPLDQYAALASQFNPVHFDADALVALANAASGLRLRG